MPLGIEFEERSGGDIYIKSVEKSSDAYAQGARSPGDVKETSQDLSSEIIAYIFSIYVFICAFIE